LFLMVHAFINRCGSNVFGIAIINFRMFCCRNCVTRRATRSRRCQRLFPTWWRRNVPTQGHGTEWTPSEIWQDQLNLNHNWTKRPTRYIHWPSK